MSLKLFRSTGYSTLLAPGEARLALHPRWAVAGVSAWVGLACNVALWRSLIDWQPTGLARALALGLLTTGMLGAVLSLLCWRRTFKPVATVLLMLAGAAAAGAWSHGAAAPVSELGGPWVFPGWASLLGWRVPLMLCVLALLPMLVTWNTQLRRLSGPSQWAANVRGIGWSVLLLVAAGATLRALPGA
ncbi:hypothetical protein WG922_12805 [Ramlibacter sp. AN1015]|uniref:hypothetical protein n=1 Tax=Ramlibacter sp. AN1015 TaxID=3133428 RepID=UPI0030C2B5DA